MTSLRVLADEMCRPVQLTVCLSILLLLSCDTVRRTDAAMFGVSETGSDLPYVPELLRGLVNRQRVSTAQLVS